MPKELSRKRSHQSTAPGGVQIGLPDVPPLYGMKKFHTSFCLSATLKNACLNPAITGSAQCVPTAVRIPFQYGDSGWRARFTSAPLGPLASPAIWRAIPRYPSIWNQPMMWLFSKARLSK